MTTSKIDADPSVDGSVSKPVSGPAASQTWTQTVLSQYANSPVLLGLLQSIADAIDPAPLIDDFYSEVWNIDTARGYGLDVWGRIVGISRALYVPGGATGMTWGFTEAGAGSDTWGHSPFYAGVDASPNYQLPDAAFRELIRVKAASNVSPRSIPQINAALMQMFPGRGKAYVADLGAMQMRLTFEYLLTPVETAILRQSGALPAPAGVQMTIVAFELPYVFSFAESGSQAAGWGVGAFI